MALVDALLDQVADDALRQALREQIDNMLEKQSFGLVFQPHKPETVQLPRYKVRRGSKVCDRHDLDRTLFKVEGVKNNRATVSRIMDDDLELVEKDVDDLVVVCEFGDPIYPGLRSTGSISRGGDKPFHVVINAENFHALETLLYTHERRVDAVYIDPPYNNGARTWKYNNDYVDSRDRYRHSKWLAMMQKRLELARDLLNPERSVLIVTIDENEVHRLALLLEQVFRGAKMQMVTSVINPKGASLGGDFARVEEHILFVYIGSAVVTPGLSDMLNEDVKGSQDRAVKWSSLIRGGAQGIRTDSPGAYYPIFIDPAKNVIHSFGTMLGWDETRESVKAPAGTLAVWPPTHTSGVEGRWGIGPEKAAELYEMGALRLGKVEVEKASSRCPTCRRASWRS